MLLTQYNGKILGPIAWLLSKPMNWIFELLNIIGIPNIGLSIIIFTIVIYLAMTPLTIKQQKYSKLSAKMNPEIQAIQAKYKNKKDNDSMMAMNQETKAVYAKYGVSPSGSCAQLLITMPIFLALYRVIYAIPAYVSKIGDTFRVLAEKVMSADNGSFLQNTGIETVNNVIRQYGKQLTEGTDIEKGIIDILCKLSSSDLQIVANHYDLNNLRYNNQLILNQLNSAGDIVERGLIDRYNSFLGLNIGNSPSFYFSNMVDSKFQATAILLFVGALMIPILAAVSQWLNAKLMPQPQTDANASDQQSSMNQSMKMMNNFMPIMSAVFCFSFPCGVGLYWIIGAVIRCIQQVAINKYIDKMDIDEIIKKNIEKNNAKMKKLGIDPQTVNKNASLKTKNYSSQTSSMASKAKVNVSSTNTATKTNNSTDKSSNNNDKKSGMGIAAKANMVKQYNEKNN